MLSASISVNVYTFKAPFIHTIKINQATCTYSPRAICLFIKHQNSLKMYSIHICLLPQGPRLTLHNQIPTFDACEGE